MISLFKLTFYSFCTFVYIFLNFLVLGAVMVVNVWYLDL